MEIPDETLNRRLRFDAEAQYVISRIVPGSVMRLPRGALLNRSLEVLSQSTWDAAECLRARQLVAGFDRPAPIAARLSHTLGQHPRYRTYWHAPALNSTVGMHLGVDLIKHNGGLLPG